MRFVCCVILSVALEFSHKQLLLFWSWLHMCVALCAACVCAGFTICTDCFYMWLTHPLEEWVIYVNEPKVNLEYPLSAQCDIKLQTTVPSWQTWLCIKCSRVLFYVHWRKLPFIQFYIYIHERPLFQSLSGSKTENRKSKPLRHFADNVSIALFHLKSNG